MISIPPYVCRRFPQDAHTQVTDLLDETMLGLRNSVNGPSLIFRERVPRMKNVQQLEFVRSPIAVSEKGILSVFRKALFTVGAQ